METVTPPRFIQGQGTSEACWEPYINASVLPSGTVTDLIHPSGTVHIVAPHPDDEVLGCGGMMQQLSALGVPVCVWAVTDGERSHPPTPSRTMHSLARLRTRESEQALAILSSAIRRYAVQLPDGAVSAAEEQLGHYLSMKVKKNDTVFAPWRLDGHPDHEAAARAALYAAQQQGCRFIEVPIWGWHWADPTKGEFPLERALRIPLSADELKRKTLAIHQFHSQLGIDEQTNQAPILPDYALVRYLRSFEVVLL